MSVKVGDKVFVGPWTVKRNDEWDPEWFSAAIREGSGDAIFCGGLLVADAIPDSPALIPVARWLAAEGDDGLIALEAAARFWLMAPTRSHMPTIDGTIQRLIAALEDGTR